MRFCTHCGAQLHDEAVICVKCGCACAPQKTTASVAPVGQLKTNKSVLKFILLSLLTFGIYGLVVMSSVSDSINIAASRYDGKRTLHFCAPSFLIGPITFGIAYIVWYHKISNRIGGELTRRKIDYSFNCGYYWLFCWALCFTVVCPIIYRHMLFKATNLICQDYNKNG